MKTKIRYNLDNYQLIKINEYDLKSVLNNYETFNLIVKDIMLQEREKNKKQKTVRIVWNEKTLLLRIITK